ncbi:28S ribosomal protein S23, mitochondrial [Pieris napi]|uniref:28S ribosomal protein S23, mitochondrial n=1 Tax=Pieris napi TaxID=78633 RepID=UPI001FBB40D5|nr:28S ribosomal protein S23, mitochondrial [Pieris napi]XP_047504653.1 28S ribosomal protein S23, mitochondrial [Pieris napi]
MATSRLERIGTIFTRAEGLLKHGALKPDDRPIWFDVYQAFPPLVEPKFARPKPEKKPIRQILYKEDAIRVKFHMKGHGLGLNMLSPYGETQTKKLIQKYEQLKEEGVQDTELVEKAVSSVISHKESEQITIKANPESATAQVLSEANLKNIFKQ